MKGIARVWWIKEQSRLQNSRVGEFRTWEEMKQAMSRQFLPSDYKPQGVNVDFPVQEPNPQVEEPVESQVGKVIITTQEKSPILLAPTIDFIIGEPNRHKIMHPTTFLFLPYMQNGLCGDEAYSFQAWIEFQASLFVILPFFKTRGRVFSNQGRMMQTYNPCLTRLIGFGNLKPKLLRKRNFGPKKSVISSLLIPNPSYFRKH